MGDLAQYIKRKRPSKGARGGLSEHFVRHFLKQLGKWCYGQMIHHACGLLNAEFS